MGTIDFGLVSRGFKVTVLLHRRCMGMKMKMMMFR